MMITLFRKRATYISLICVFVIAVFTAYWFRGMGLQVSVKLRLAFEPLTAISFETNITFYFQVDSMMRVVLTLKCKSPSTGFAFIHDFIMTIPVLCHCTRQTKKLGAIRTWCQQMIIQVMLVVSPHIIQFCITCTTFEFPFFFNSFFIPYSLVTNVFFFPFLSSV